MERAYRFLQIMALIVALVAPPFFLVGYAYDWGFLDSFAIEHQMFIKAPQEYLGVALVVIFMELVAAFIAIWKQAAILVFILITLGFIVFAFRYWVLSPKLWSKLYLRFSNLRERIIRKLNLRLVESAASAYLFSSLSVLSFIGVVYILVLIFSPALFGYKKGQEAAKKLMEEWKVEACAPKSSLVGCAQVLEGRKIIASGKMIVASEKHAAIFDGRAVKIYSLNNRDIRTVLPENK